MNFGHSKTISNIRIGWLSLVMKSLFLRLWMNLQIFHRIQEITQVVDLVKGDEASYADVR